MTRNGTRVSLSLNGQPWIDVDGVDQPRFGIHRDSDRHVQIRKLRLTGPWPDEVPARWLESSAE
jgi:hypothetical protein